MREDPLTPAQRRLLARLKGQEATRGFYLAGGSGLALRLGHRRSVDHDFFTPDPFAPTDLQARLAALLGSLKPMQVEKGTLTVQVKEVGKDVGSVKASFFHYPYPLLGALEEVGGLFPTASLLDVALMKLTAIADRGARKDFIDLHAILQTGLRLKDVFEALPRKFPGVSYQRYHFLKALTYFEDAKEEPLQLLRPGPSWDEIQGFFRREVAGLSP
ncbi:MAG: nucleotidyl transferase AbiEii/AbiGii toxin family protein [Planctomycetes bacterium]|nr:nucleotidyl transferase AbiEii/AbiGii toxin family protein [Planctomycetota bacterium]